MTNLLKALLCGMTLSALSLDGSVGLLINTLMGPVVVGSAVGDSEHYKFFFEIGRAYF